MSQDLNPVSLAPEPIILPPLYPISPLYNPLGPHVPITAFTTSCLACDHQPACNSPTQLSLHYSSDGQELRHLIFLNIPEVSSPVPPLEWVFVQ